MTRDDQFEQFWHAYPRRVGKGAARKAFYKAIGLTTLQTMLAALEAYKAHKPAYQDFCHPSTWLNQERWDDEWETQQSAVTDHNQMAGYTRALLDQLNERTSHH